MKMDPISAAMKAPTRRRSPCCSIAAAVPTSTGAIAAGSVRGRAAINQIRTSGPLRVLREVGAASLLIGVAALLSLLRHVEEEGRVMGELLDPGNAILDRVEARFEQPQRQRGEGGHLAAPGHGLALDLCEREHRVHQTHVQRLLGVVETREEPDLLRLLDADVPFEERCPEAAVEASDPRPRLAEDGVVGCDGHVADQVEDVAAPDRIALDHRDDGLWQTTDLHVQVADVEAPDALLRHVVLAYIAVVSANPLVATGAEGPIAGPGEDDRRDLGVVPGAGEGIAELRQSRRPEGVVNLRPVDRDLRDRVTSLVEDVLVVALGPPLDRRIELILRRCVFVSPRHSGA